MTASAGRWRRQFFTVGAASPPAGGQVRLAVTHQLQESTVRPGNPLPGRSRHRDQPGLSQAAQSDIRTRQPPAGITRNRIARIH
jgi:hypothetical protein